MDAQVHGHEDDINAVAFADASSHILFSGGDDGLCKVCQRSIGNFTQYMLTITLQKLLWTKKRMNYIHVALVKDN